MNDIVVLMYLGLILNNNDTTPKPVDFYISFIPGITLLIFIIIFLYSNYKKENL